MGKGLAQRYNYKDFDREREIDEFKFTLPKPPKKEDIDGYKLKKSDQRFTPPDKKYVKELSYRIATQQKLSSSDRKFISLQWERRLNGYWFYNNGYLEYITGLHYYYLTAWNIVRVEDAVRRDGTMGKRKVSGLPKFTDSDRDYFYIWNDCDTDENCFGLIHITNRRDGKTYRSTATANELVSRSPDSIAGIQSKTDTDGSKVFKKLVKSWKALPEYYKPVDVGDSDPAKRLEYRNPKRRSSKTQVKEYSEVLDSEVNFGNAKEEYYDGDGLAFIFHDEIGKTPTKIADVRERWYIVKECLADGADVTGKGLLTTTVEDMEKKGGMNCKNLWDESSTDSDSYIKSKQTESGLKRYFKPAYYGLRGSDKSEDGDETPTFIDEYGYSDVVKAEAFLIKIEKMLTGDALISRRRKYPRSIDDAFIISGKGDTFPTYKLYEQKEYNDTMPDSMVRRGNFVWANESRLEVEFHDDPKGFFRIAWMPDHENRCKYTTDNRGLPVPAFAHTGNIGVDPFDHKETVDSKKSDAAGYLFKKFDVNNIKNSNGWVMSYVGRRANPDDFYEDIIMASVFYGVPFFPENQKPGIINHAIRRGYKNYIKQTKQGDYTKSDSKKTVDGVSTAGEMVRDQMINILVRHCYKFMGKISHKVQREDFGWADKDLRDDLYGLCPFDELIDDMLRFDANNWTPSDQTVAAMLSVLGETPVKVRNNRKEDLTKSLTLDSLFKKYKL
jgi:hypothetical protein